MEHKSSENKDLKFIKSFSKIKISEICKKLKIDKCNLWANKTSHENIKLVKEEIIAEYERIKKELDDYTF